MNFFRLKMNHAVFANSLNLQLFGEGDSAGSSSADNGETVSAVNSKAVSASFAAKQDIAKKQQDNKKMAPRILYGKQDEMNLQATQNKGAYKGEASAASQQADTENKEKPAETFDDLIHGKYKEDFQKQVEGILKKRFKNNADLERQVSSMRELLENTARGYGLDPASESLLDDIRKAQDADDELYAKEAYDHGMSVGEYKKSIAREREVKTLQEKVREHEEREAQRAWIQHLQGQVQKSFPSFNLDEEMKNPNFAYLVRPGSPTSIEDAMYAIHHREILTGAVKTAAEQASLKTANAVAANGARPKEGGLSSVPPTIVKSDPSKWTKEDRAAIRERVARGEKIRL